MKPEIVLAYDFVEYIPEELKERTLYISKKYGTAVHKCCCGCGREIVTPLSPTGWKLTFDGKTVSLHPSIGSWSLPCQSHYCIIKSKVVWAGQWSKEQIARGREREALARQRFFDALSKTGTAPEPGIGDAKPMDAPAAGRKPKEGFWKRLLKWFWG